MATIERLKEQFTSIEETLADKHSPPIPRSERGMLAALANAVQSQITLHADLARTREERAEAHTALRDCADAFDQFRKHLPDDIEHYWHLVFRRAGLLAATDTREGTT